MGSFNPVKILNPPKPQAPVIAAPAPAPAPPPAPTVDNSADDIGKAQAEEQERLKKQRGRAATLLTGGSGITGDDSAGIATKTLLGG